MNEVEKVNSDWPDDKIRILKNTVCKGASDEELQLFMHVCVRTGLDPFMKQIHSVPRGGQRLIITGIDGLRLIADRTGRYSPGKEATIVYDATGNNIVSATAYIKKMTLDGTWHEVSATAHWSEYNPGSSPIWKKMPHVMLAKCAESAALRKAFPAEMSAVYSEEEMHQAKVKIEKDNEGVQDISPDELENFLSQWGDEKDSYRQYMEHMMKSREWDQAEAIEKLSTNIEFTKKQFQNWQSTRSSAKEA